MTIGIEDDQEDVLRAYTGLCLLRPDWGGVLILSRGLERQGRALAMAANIAGAVCLSVEERPELLKEALRSGSCDFIVNTLDEALRAMKNEVRKHLPVSVGLRGNPAGVLQECVSRGVQPEVFFSLAEDSPHPAQEEEAIHASIQRLQQQGTTLAALVGDRSEEGVLDVSAMLTRFVAERQWELRSYSVENAADLRAFDARALVLLSERDTLRRQWLRSASRMIQRKSPLRRALWLTAAEGETLEASVLGHAV